MKLQCCKPVPSFRSEWAWNHAKDCPDYPGQPVGMEKAHPAFQSSRDPAYVDAHMDDQDDERGRDI